MKNRNQLKVKLSLVLGEKEKIKTKKVFYGSLFFIFLSILGTLAIWFFRISWQKTISRLKTLGQPSAPKFFSRLTPLKILFLLAAFNLSIWGWLNQKDIFSNYKPLISTIKEAGFPVALGKTEEEVVLGAEDAVKINDLKREMMTENSWQNALGAEKDLNLSLTQERCQKDKLEGKSSELCGKYEKNEALERELKKMDYPAIARRVVRNPAAGKGHCAESNDHPGKSDTKGKHTDEDCCPDPDEYPNPGCYYTSSGYALMLKR
jgi:hypothetical protein